MKKLLTLLFIAIATTSYAQTNDFDYSVGITRSGITNVNYYWPIGNTTRNFEEINRVVIMGDTAKEYAFLQKAYQCNDSLYFLLLDIYELIKKNGIATNASVRPVVNGCINTYNDFHDLHVVHYPLTGTIANKFINLYKNYYIRKTEVEHLIDILSAYNRNGFTIKAVNKTLYDKYIKDYNDYFVIIQSKQYWGEQ